MYSYIKISDKFTQEWKKRGITAIAKTEDTDQIEKANLLIWELLDINPEEEVKGLKIIVEDKWVLISNTWEFKQKNLRYPAITFYYAEDMEKGARTGYEKKVKKTIFTRGASSRRKYGYLQLKINYVFTTFYK